MKTCLFGQFRGSSLFTGNFVQGYQYGGIDSPGVVQECTSNGLYPLGLFGVQCLRGVSGGKLIFLAVDWDCPRMRQMLGAFWMGMIKFFESFGHIVRHGYVDKTFVIIPSDGEPEI